MTDQDIDPRIGSEIGGRYRIEALLGGGGMGAVYAAEDLEDGRAIAIKLLHPRLAAEDHHLARFRREAEVASELSHPNVVRVLGHGEEADGTPWMAMERVRGESLSALLRREGSLSPERAVRIVRQIVFAMAAVHDVGVVHRDLKPGNVMLVDGDRVVVVDFGLARFFGSDTFQKLTMTGQVVGTPTYMSPEQAFGDPVDARTDIFSIGAILHALLVGRPPFGRGRIEEILPRLLDDDRIPLTETNPELGALASVVDRCLSANPDARYATATALDQALMPFDPSPTKTLAEWTRPPSLDALVLAPDPVLDAPRKRKLTAATRRVRRAPPQKAAPSVEVEEAGQPEGSSRLRLALLVLFAAVTGLTALVVFLATRSEHPERASSSAADAPMATTPVPPVAVEGFDAGAEDADADADVAVAAAPSADTPEARAHRSVTHPSTHVRTDRSARPEHAEAVHVRLVVGDSDQPFERVRAALLAGGGDMTRCYEEMDGDLPTSNTSGTLELSRTSATANPREGLPELHTCVERAFVQRFGARLGASGEFSVSIRYWVRASARNGVEVVDVADRPSGLSVEAGVTVISPGVWTRGELTDELGERLDDVKACLSRATPLTHVYQSTVRLTFDGGAEPRSSSIDDQSYNLPPDVYACVYRPLTERTRLPARPDPRGQGVTFRVTLTPVSSTEWIRVGQ